MRELADVWIAVQTFIFQTFVSPVIFHLGFMQWFESAFNAVEFVMLGLVQITVIAVIMRTFERRWPLEPVEDKRLMRVDQVYTVLAKLGIGPLLVFAAAQPVTAGIEHLARVWGITPFRLEHLVPWLRENPLAAFLVYFALYDFAAYWVHRAQHKLPFWWALHSLHHSQRQVSVWTDDRNHMLDDFLVTIVLVTFAQFVGVQPEEFVAIMMLGRLIESWSHANVRFDFGPVLERVIVGPRFHRLHHALADPSEPHIHDHNFAPVLPVWDILFGTAIYDRRNRPTGVDDPKVDADNERGWFGQQIAVFARFGRALIPRFSRA